MDETLSIPLNRLEKLRELARFKPSLTVKALEDSNDQFLAGWMLARLLGWVFFGQRNSARETGDAHRSLRYGRAYKIGQTYNWLYLRNHLSGPGSALRAFDELPNQSEVAFALYFLVDEMKPRITHGGVTLSMLLKRKRWNCDLLYAHKIIEFLVRAHKYRPELCRANVARHYAMMSNPGDFELKASAIEKLWNHYRAVAPYVFAFYPLFFKSSLDPYKPVLVENEEEWINRIVMAVRQSELRKCLGYASYAADILTMKASDVRDQDFGDIDCIEPSTEDLDTNEIAIIDGYKDKKGRSAK